MRSLTPPPSAHKRVVGRGWGLQPWSRSPRSTSTHTAETGGQCVARYCFLGRVCRVWAGRGRTEPPCRPFPAPTPHPAAGTPGRSQGGWATPREAAALEKAFTVTLSGFCRICLPHRTWPRLILRFICRRIHAFELWCWRRPLRVPWTARRSNQSILKEMAPHSSTLAWKIPWTEEPGRLKTMGSCAQAWKPGSQHAGKLAGSFHRNTAMEMDCMIAPLWI